MYNPKAKAEKPFGLPDPEPHDVIAFRKTPEPSQRHE
jgi:hypothetical protein